MSFNYIYLLFSLLFVSCASNAQNEGLKITYKKKIISSLDGKKGKALKKENPKLFEEYYAIEKKRKEAAKRLKYKLLITNQSALFEVEEILKRDGRNIAAFGPFKGNYYTNLNTEENYWQVDAFGRDFLVDFGKRGWKLKEEKKEILGYICKKAVGSWTVNNDNNKSYLKVEAWYAPEIPLNFGPLGFNGLPGLILEISTVNERYYATRIKKSKNLNIEKPVKGQKISFDDFNAMAKGAMQNAKQN
ncbi:GLPGLI family protein [Haloflavibacter putidus]|uniref:GLPGLI family protein n=1 Tax=Haloflavibacter putidus TaxID=2576776 RepID=A0A508A179_9FLAO|nr:GLPGLI family protein [Haloflavibacter putidus]TQD40695.1 GLPGLI family protein [Haloflavibacter putidus]